MNGLQHSWIHNLIFVATETLDVEYDDEVGLLGVRIAQRMGPTMGLVVRKWQPFNGLEVFTPN